ncbi:MAG: hypothetical protein ACRESZ_16390, partial [Methylococcales bacterium]
MTAVLEREDNASEQALYMVLELSNNKWKVGFSDGERSRQNTIDVGDWVALNEGQSGGRRRSSSARRIAGFGVVTKPVGMVFG